MKLEGIAEFGTWLLQVIVTGVFTTSLIISFLIFGSMRWWCCVKSTNNQFEVALEKNHLLFKKNGQYLLWTSVALTILFRVTEIVSFLRVTFPIVLIISCIVFLLDFVFLGAYLGKILAIFSIDRIVKKLRALRFRLIFKKTFRLALIFLVLYFPAKYFLFPPPKVGACDKYTQYFRGGVYSYNSIPYLVMLCGTRGRFDVDLDHVRLQVHSMEGELLAQRWFAMNWQSGASNKLDYYGNLIFYYDKGAHQDIGTDELYLKMPPSKLDWLRARLP